MAVTMEKFIEELNKDLEYEYAAVIQYIQHATTLSGPQYDSIIKEILVHSTEELQHAVTLSEQISFLGGVPTTKVEKIETSPKNAEMLKQDLDGEEIAITRYKERIRQAEELEEYGVRRLIEDILVMEEEHKRDLQNAI